MLHVSCLTAYYLALLLNKSARHLPQVLLGSTVTSYINVQVPEADDGSTKPSPGTASSTGSPPPPHPGGGSTMPARGWSEVGPGAGATDGERRNNGDEKEETSSPAVNMGRKSLYRRSSFSDDITRWREREPGGEHLQRVESCHLALKRGFGFLRPRYKFITCPFELSADEYAPGTFSCAFPPAQSANPFQLCFARCRLHGTRLLIVPSFCVQRLQMCLR